MPRPRTPMAKAVAAGRDIENPARFDGRNEPAVENGVGEPPDWMKPPQKRMWAEFQKEIPWLNESHRSLLEIASVIRARLLGGEEVGVQALNLLRQCLGQMGATPADASKAGANFGDERETDAADKYFNS